MSSDVFEVGYTGVYNILDYSCVSFPTGLTVDKEVDKLDPNYEPLGPVCKDVNEQCECSWLSL